MYVSRWLIILFPFLIKYYRILFIHIVYRLGSDKLVSCFLFGLPQGISRGMWLLAWGRVNDFSFSIIQVHFVFLLVEIHYAFSISCIVLTCYVYYYCIWYGFNTLFSCFFAGFLLFSPKGSVTGCDSSLRSLY